MTPSGQASAERAAAEAARTHDVLVVGAGPAGLSAALVLGRCRRDVVVVDAGKPRNRRARAAHGVFTRDGTPPGDLLAIARSQLEPYAVTVVDDEVTRIERDGDAFVATTKDERRVRARKLLLATGMRDHIPERPGLADLVGRGVYVCPYCDGWENRDRRLAAYAPAADVAETALGLLTWSRDVVAITAGERVGDDDKRRLARNGVRLVEDDVAAVESAGDGEDRTLACVVLATGERLAVDALFVHFGEEQAAPFVAELGCSFTPNGTAYCREGERAGPPGVFVAGDCSHDLQLVAIAVAEGVKAACAINTELRREDHP